MKKTGVILLLTACLLSARAEDGYDLWLRYRLIDNLALLQQYRSAISGILMQGNSATITAAKEELSAGLQGLLGKTIPVKKDITAGCIVTGTPVASSIISSLSQSVSLQKAGNEGYVIKSINIKGVPCIVIAGNTDIGVLYGVFHFLRLLQTNQGIKNISIVVSPNIERRLLNHWDNLTRTVERGYAGFSIWDWHKLPDYIDPRYKDYARANASIGINGTVLTNVNANAFILTAPYLEKVAALANVFRTYGVRVYLTARFSAP